MFTYSLYNGKHSHYNSLPVKHIQQSYFFLDLIVFTFLFAPTSRDCFVSHLRLFQCHSIFLLCKSQTSAVICNLNFTQLCFRKQIFLLFISFVSRLVSKISRVFVSGTGIEMSFPGLHKLWISRLWIYVPVKHSFVLPFIFVYFLFTSSPIIQYWPIFFFFLDHPLCFKLLQFNVYSL